MNSSVPGSYLAGEALLHLLLNKYTRKKMLHSATSVQKLYMGTFFIAVWKTGYYTIFTKYDDLL